MTNHTYNSGTPELLETAQRADKIELAARFGYAAKGLVYVTVGALTLLAALGFAKGDITGTRGALEMFNEQAWGPFALAIIATGLTGFALWRVVQALHDTDDKGSDARAMTQRAGLLMSGGIYASLAFYAVKLLLGMTANSADTGKKATQLMTWDGGQLAVGLLGVGIVGVGLYQLLRVIKATFKDDWKTADMSAAEERTATLISTFGIGARAIAFVLIGVFLSWAAISDQPEKAQGMEGMLTRVAQNPWGQTMVGLAGAGLVCYGIYCFVNALFRQIDTQSGSSSNRSDVQESH